MSFKPLEWRDNKLIILDQTLLPDKEVYLETADYREVARAIKNLTVRGAPAIGVAAAYGFALGALEIQSGNQVEFTLKLEKVSRVLSASRPTARNLFWALERMESVVRSIGSTTQIKKLLLDEALQIHREQLKSDVSLSHYGSAFIADGNTILTHCNTGALATAGYGTALGVIRQAHQEGRQINIIATETRPLLQGARLTAWELKQYGIPFTLITDSMAAYFMRKGKIDLVITGADCIAANGDTANKIGTYALAVLAKEHNIPFYIAAPTSTIDLSLSSGNEIIIEERSPEEVTHIRGVRIAPEHTPVFNPSFDVTPHQYITAIITEKGVIRKPFGEGMQKFSGLK
jgi:methylthioribose-1-phosphate isomerase